MNVLPEFSLPVALDSKTHVSVYIDGERSTSYSVKNNSVVIDAAALGAESRVRIVIVR